MADIKIYKTQDLVLEVKEKFDPAKLKLKQWVDFIDVLCGYLYLSGLVSTEYLVLDGEVPAVFIPKVSKKEKNKLRDKYPNIDII